MTHKNTNRSYMLKAGSTILSIWCGLNIIPSIGILASILFLNGNTPALTALLSASEVSALDSDILATANSIAVFANGLNVALCLLFLIAIWKGLFLKMKWVFWALVSASIFALIAGAGADYVVGTQFPEINVISGLILAVGFLCAARDIFQTNSKETVA